MIRLETIIELKFLNSYFSSSNFSIRAFRLILLLKLDEQLPVEQFEATVSQSTVPCPSLTDVTLAEGHSWCSTFPTHIPASILGSCRSGKGGREEGRGWEMHARVRSVLSTLEATILDVQSRTSRFEHLGSVPRLMSYGRRRILCI